MNNDLLFQIYSTACSRGLSLGSPVLQAGLPKEGFKNVVIEIKSKNDGFKIGTTLGHLIETISEAAISEAAVNSIAPHLIKK